MVLTTRSKNAMSQQQNLTKASKHTTIPNNKKSYISTQQVILNLVLNIKNSLIGNKQAANSQKSEASSSNTQEPDHDVYIEIIDPNLKLMDLTDDISQIPNDSVNNNEVPT